MMHIKISGIIAVVISTMLFFQSCENEDIDKEGNEVKISTYNDTESHNAGQDCMTCHISGGDGEGWFTLAGTVYDSLKATVYPNSTITLYDQPNQAGNLVATIEVDGLGNFYTTISIDFSTGLYASVVGEKSTQDMNSSLTFGNCNSCHGVSLDRIWTK